MNYHKYYNVDVVNGPGTRCSLFVSGCEHKCRGCYNKSTWRVDSGILYTKEIEDKIISDLNDKEIKRCGLSILGGDPLLPSNISEVLSLVKRVKSECENKNIWIWTGYDYNELNLDQRVILNYTDVLIDGRFIQEKYSPDLLWRGSSNQNIIEVKNIF